MQTVFRSKLGRIHNLKQPYQNTKMSAVDRKKDYGNKETDLFAQILRGKMWNVVVHSLTLYLNSLQIFTLFHHIMPILHVFLVKHPYFKFLPVSPGFCRLKLAGLNRFLPAGLNRSGRNQTTLNTMHTFISQV